MTCPVFENCKAAGKHCPYCVNGSEYRPIDKKILFPAIAERARERKEAKKEHRASKSYRTGRRSNQKGKRREREIAKLLGGERVPLSGALDGHPNDVILPNGWRTEVKARHEGLGILYTWMADAEVVAFREPGEPWLFALTLTRFKLWMDGAGLRRQAVTAAMAAIARGAADTKVGNVVIESHERKSGFSKIRQWMAAENADALLFKADRRDWLVVMDERHLREILVSVPSVARISGE